MEVYNRKTFEIYNLNQISQLKKKLPNKNINLFHPYKYLIFQGPFLAQKIKLNVKKKNLTYIADPFVNIGLIIILMDLNIQNLSISIYLDKKIKEKILSLAKKKSKYLLH